MTLIESDKGELDYAVIRGLDDLTDRAYSIESAVRHSPEYRNFLGYVKEDLAIRNCDFFKTIDFVEEDLTFEMHHMIPFTLYNVVMMAGGEMLTRLKPNEYLTTLDVASQVIRLHMDDCLPICMLSKTIHEMVHAGKYDIEPGSKSVHLGDYGKLISLYGDMMSDDDLAMLRKYGADESIIKASLAENKNKSLEGSR